MLGIANSWTPEERHHKPKVEIASDERVRLARYMIGLGLRVIIVAIRWKPSHQQQLMIGSIMIG